LRHALRNPARLPNSERIRLDEVLRANQPLPTVYVMAEQLRSLWNVACPWHWRRLWKDWLGQAADSQIPALMQFAAKLQPYWRGMLCRVRWPMHTGQLEGINNKIKLIKLRRRLLLLEDQGCLPGNP
jgi:transposase